MNGTKSKSNLRHLLQRQSVFLIMIIITLSIGVTLANDRFISPLNIMNLFRQISVTGICAISTAIVLITGGFDLSIGSLVSFVACVIATLVNRGLSEVTAILLGILCGILCGALNGAVIAYSRCAPVIITLGTMGIFKGGALLIAGGNIINFKAPVAILTSTKFLGIPTIVYIYLLVTVVAFIFLQSTVIGRRIYSLGGNEEASFLAGVNVTHMKVLTYTIDGFIVSFAAIALLMRLGSASAVMGDSYTLNAVAAAVIGGVSISGGKGSIGGCFLGVLLLGIISNAMNLLGVTAYLQEIILGLIVVVAAVISQMGNRRD